MIKTSVISCVFAVCVLHSQNSSCGEFENAPELRAADVAPQVKGQGYSVEDKVSIERFMLGFEIKSPMGIYKVNSKEMLLLRLRELEILSRAKEISGMEQFADSMKDSVVQVPVGVVETVFNPVTSTKQVGQGIRNKFSAIGGMVSGREKSDYEDSTVKEAAIGAHKRGIAAELGLDVYSTNPKVQKLLNHLAKARALGAAPVRLAGSAAPTPVGLALTVLRLRRDGMKDLATKSPNELHMLNNGILKKLNIPESIRDAFNDNSNYSPRHKTAIVADLEAMKDVGGLQNFLATTLDDDCEDEALFAERQADMMLIYHKQVERIDRIGRAGNLPFAITKDNDFVVLAPLDYLFLNEQSNGVLERLHVVAGELKAKVRVLVVSGTASPGFKAKAQSLGFSTTEQFGQSVNIKGR